MREKRCNTVTFDSVREIPPMPSGSSGWSRWIKRVHVKVWAKKWAREGQNDGQAL
jgi:hypothetical protein